MADSPQGWHPDPFGRHEARYFSAVRPTHLVRDGLTEGCDPVDESVLTRPTSVQVTGVAPAVGYGYPAEPSVPATSVAQPRPPNPPTSASAAGEGGRPGSVRVAIGIEAARGLVGVIVQCGSDSYLEFDHVIPHSLGGATSEANLQLLCRGCNAAKGGRL